MNLPNALTILRIFFVPLLVAALVQETVGFQVGDVRVTNDWLSLALIDGYRVPHWVGVTGYVAFVCAMTVGRVTGPPVLDRFGRAPVLWGSSALAATGTLLVILGGHLAVVGVGIVLWGLGASLGFPVGMSAAADDPVRAAARVSVVSTIGYSAFLAGPPLIGLLAQHVGYRHALLVVIVPIAVGLCVVGAAAPLKAATVSPPAQD